MILSEYIKLLQELMKNHGDISVVNCYMSEAIEPQYDCTEKPCVLLDFEEDPY